MIVCVCNAINDHAIRQAIAEGHDTLDALQFELGVGSNCGKCIATACGMLHDAALGTPVHFVQRPVHRPSTREVELA